MTTRFFWALALTTLSDALAGLAVLGAAIAVGYWVFVLGASLYLAIIGGPVLALLAIGALLSAAPRMPSWRDFIFARFGFGAAPSRPVEGGVRRRAAAYAALCGALVLPIAFAATALFLISVFDRNLADAVSLIILIEIIIGGPTFLVVFISAYDRAKSEFTPPIPKNAKRPGA